MAEIVCQDTVVNQSEECFNDDAELRHAPSSGSLLQETNSDGGLVTQKTSSASLPEIYPQRLCSQLVFKTVVLCPLLSRNTATSVDFNWTPPTLPQAAPTCVSVQACDASSERSYAGRQMFLINNHSPPERQVRAGLSWNTRHLEWPTDRAKFSVFTPQTDFSPRTVPLQQR